MNLLDIENKLNQMKASAPEELPDVVNEQMNKAFTELANIPVKRRSHLKYVLSSAAAVFIIGLGVIGSAFISPAMAKSLKEIPIIQNIFTLTHHIGLQTADEKGMLESINQSVTMNGVTLTITKLVYTGSNIVLVLEEDTPDHTNNNRDFSISALVNGKPGDITISRGFMKNYGRINAPSASIITISHAEYNSKTKEKFTFPDQFDLTLKVRLIGMEKEQFTFNIPVQKNETDGKVITPDLSPKEWQGYTFSVKRIELTPIMTKLNMHVDYGKQQNDSVNRIRFGYSLVDQDGYAISSESRIGGLIGGTTIMSELLDLDPFPKIPKSITIKPYLYEYKENGIQREYIPELEMAIPVGK